MSKGLKDEGNCEECEGLGAIETYCDTCSGSGEGRADGMSCGACGGSGDALARCEACQGTGEAHEWTNQE